jgi:hypothetical protein
LGVEILFPANDGRGFVVVGEEVDKQETVTRGVRNEKLQ